MLTSRWNAETFRALSRQWQADADDLPAGTERDVCLELAKGYADLATILERQGF